MTSNHVLRAHIESLVVERVSDLRIGLRPRRAAYIKAADLAVVRRFRLLLVDSVAGPLSFVLAWTGEELGDASLFDSCPIQ
jgi:hypothetical protein